MRMRYHHVVVHTEAMTDENDPVYMSLSHVPFTPEMAEAVGSAWLEIYPQDIVMVVTNDQLCDCGSTAEENGGTIHYQDCHLILMDQGLL